VHLNEDRLNIVCVRRKCSPGTLVSIDFRFVRILAGFWRGVSHKGAGVVENGDFKCFCSLYVWNLQR